MSIHCMDLWNALHVDKKPDNATDVLQILNELNSKNVESVNGVETLVMQADVLDTLFHHLLQRAMYSTDLKITDMLVKHAMRAQSQCRNTFEAVSEIRNPRIAGYVKQANISAGHQQVNNGEPIHARKIENSNLQTKLTEGLADDLQTNSITPTTSKRASEPDQAVVTLNRAANSGR